MALERLSSWADVGDRVAQARGMLGLTQDALGDRLGLGRTVIVKIESGSRNLSALELAELARVTELPIEWFVTESPPVVASRRAEGIHETSLIDARIEALAREVTQLRELDLLRPDGNAITLQVPKSVRAAEQAAMRVRDHLGYAPADLINLASASERLNVFAYSLELPNSQTDGAYVALDEECGVALVNGAAPSARRRFTLAHEIGHHVFQDAYAVDADVLAGGDTERFINAFAIHLLLPREVLERRWSELGGRDDHRDAAIAIGAEFRVSWTALCGHLVNVGLLDRHVGEVLRESPPRKAEYLELGVSIAEELAPPTVPPAVAQAALRGYRRHLLGTGRTLELLHGAVAEGELPEQDDIPLAALAGELSAG